MIDFLGYGAIGIALASAILSFRLLVAEQKKENPSEPILKMIKLFIGLTVFFALFFGFTELFKERKAKNFTVKSAVEFLRTADSTEFVLNSQPGSKNADVVLNFGKGESVILGGLLGDPTKNLNAKKGNDGNSWGIFFGDTPLGEIETELMEYRLIADSTNGKKFEKGTWYPVNDSDFWFKINEISGKFPNYVYNVSYGEGSNQNDVVEAPRSMDYSKTDDGYIFLKQEFERVYHKSWMKQYYVKFGAGLALAGTESVQKLNVHVIAVNLK